MILKANLLLLKPDAFAHSHIEMIEWLLCSKYYCVFPQVCLYVVKNLELFPQIFMTAVLHLCSAVGIPASLRLFWGLVPGTTV